MKKADKMSITKPYYRIIRHGCACSDDYIIDKRYAEDRFVLCQAYKIIEDDLKKIFESIEPSNQNGKVYSHRLYELFLRCATEFETNSKRILSANGYRKKKHFNIEDYHKINYATRLSEYKLRLNIWYPKEKIFTPLKEWSKGHSLKWYQDYNSVKHDRSGNFQKASFINVINAASGVLAILFSQFDTYAFNPYNDQLSFQATDDNYLYTDTSLFSIKPFANWSKTETYDFDWDKLKKLSHPLQMYNFYKI